MKSTYWFLLQEELHVVETVLLIDLPVQIN